jgi:aryl-alcohol dehydrogenase-like predicted oxidoreductase
MSRALPESTKSCADKFPELLHKTLGKTNLAVAACGFGSYRVDYRVQEHFDTMRYAIENGINLIDTSSNYSDGGSEILVGRVLRNVIEENKLDREGIVIVTKAGYIQGKTLEAAGTRPFPEVVEYSKGLWHCIHPEFLEDQLSQSLERMQLETIDIYLLHNPEYFLDAPGTQELSLNELRHEYYRRIRNAFEYLEAEVGDGTISCYGISSNSFVKDSSDRTFTSLEQCAAIAESIGLQNHFHVIEFPLNLYETGAAAVKNQVSDTKTLLEYAGEKNFGVLVNRPLNAVSARTLYRLADFEIKNEYLSLDQAQVIAEINLLDSMEQDLLKEHVNELELSEKNREAVNSFIESGRLLRENWRGFGSIENFNDIKKQFLIPRMNYAFSLLISSPKISGAAKDELDKIARQVNKVIAIVETIYGVKANMRSKDLHMKLNKMNEDRDFHKLSLSQKAILMINSLDAVSCILVGMRQKKYVDDVLGALRAKLVEEGSLFPWFRGLQNY